MGERKTKYAHPVRTEVINNSAGNVERFGFQPIE
jgi:hypothetical protein